MSINSATREDFETHTEFDNLPGMTETFRAAERKRNAGKPGYDSFGNPAPTIFGALGGMTTPPAITLSRQEAEGDRTLEALSERFGWKEFDEDAGTADSSTLSVEEFLSLGTLATDEDDDQLEQLRDRFNA